MKLIDKDIYNKQHRELNGRHKKNSDRFRCSQFISGARTSSNHLWVVLDICWTARKITSFGERMHSSFHAGLNNSLFNCEFGVISNRSLSNWIQFSCYVTRSADGSNPFAFGINNGVPLEYHNVPFHDNFFFGLMRYISRHKTMCYYWIIQMKEPFCSSLCSAHLFHKRSKVVFYNWTDVSLD